MNKAFKYNNPYIQQFSALRCASDVLPHLSRTPCLRRIAQAMAAFRVVRSLIAPKEDAQVICFSPSGSDAYYAGVLMAFRSAWEVQAVAMSSNQTKHYVPRANLPPVNRFEYLRSANPKQTLLFAPSAKHVVLVFILGNDNLSQVREWVYKFIEETAANPVPFSVVMLAENGYYSNSACACYFDLNAQYFVHTAQRDQVKGLFHESTHRQEVASYLGRAYMLASARSLHKTFAEQYHTAMKKLLKDMDESRITRLGALLHDDEARVQIAKDLYSFPTTGRTPCNVNEGKPLDAAEVKETAKRLYEQETERVTCRMQWQLPNPIEVVDNFGHKLGEGTLHFSGSPVLEMTLPETYAARDLFKYSLKVVAEPFFAAVHH